MHASLPFLAAWWLGIPVGIHPPTPGHGIPVPTVEAGPAPCGLPGAPPRVAPEAGALLHRLPLAFVENRGQWDTPARFVARRGGMTARLEDDGVLLQIERRLSCEEIAGVLVRLSFEGASPLVLLEGERAQSGAHNFFLGNDPAKWRVDVPGYASVLYRGLYEGVDLRVREDRGRLEYDLLLSAGIDPARVRIRCEGVEGLALEPDGTLSLRTALGPIRQKPPPSWQETSDGRTRSIDCRYVILDERRFVLEAPGLDPALPLVIDPGIEWSTFLGGPSAETAMCVRLGLAGTPTVGGSTDGSGFPTTPGAYDATPAYMDGFVTRLTADGTALVYSTLLGGSSADRVTDLALGNGGVTALTGWTVSPNFPTTPGTFDSTYSGDGTYVDAFVARLGPAGNTLSFSTYLGGPGSDDPNSMTLDPGGAVTIVGGTTSTNFPITAGAYDPTHGGGVAPAYDAFVTRFPPTGSGLVFSTFLGGSGTDYGWAAALEPAGSLAIVGSTGSPGFPTTPGAFDSSLGGGPSTLVDAFITRLNASGTGLLYSSFLGGSDVDQAWALALDSSGAIVVAGATRSTDYPTTPGAPDVVFSGGASDFQEGFVTRLDPTGTALEFSTFLGGSTADYLWEVFLDGGDRATVAGYTFAADFPTTPGAVGTSTPVGTSGESAFVARLNRPGTALVYSTYLTDGTSVERLFGAALDATGAHTVCGEALTPGFPTTAGAIDTTWDSSADAFVTRIDLLPAGVSRFGFSTPGCDGLLAIGVNAWPQLANPAFGVTCTAAPPNAGGLLGISPSPASPPIPVAGILLALDPVGIFFLLATSDDVGLSEVPLPVPPNPLLLGAHLYVQFFWPDPCALGGVSASNALSIIVQP